MLNIKENLKRNRPKLTSVKAVGIAEDANPIHRESMEVTLASENINDRMNTNLLINLVVIPSRL
jgi:hypothetical protein